jgi:hypothetical protein
MQETTNKPNAHSSNGAISVKNNENFIENLTPVLHFNNKIIYKIFDLYVKRVNATNSQHCYKIKSSHANSFKLLLAKYQDQLREGQLKGKISKGILKSSALATIPMMETYNGSIMAAANSQALNTARNHRKRFLDTGLVLEEHSDCGKVLLRINPIFYLLDIPSIELVEKYVEAMNKARIEKAENPAQLALLRVGGSTFAPLVAKRYYLQYNQECGQVENSSHIGFNKERSAELRQKEETEKKGNCKNTAEGAKNLPAKEGLGNLSEPGRKRKIPGAARKKSKEAPEAVAVFVVQLIRDFWRYAHQKLYPNLQLDDERKRQLLRFFYYQYFCWKVNPWSKEQWSEYYLQMIQRLEIAHQWKQRRPTFVMPRPENYFAPPDPDKPNEMKFHRTAEFFVNNLAAQEMRRVQQEALEYELGKCYQEKTPLQLFRLHEKRIKRLNNARYLEQFYKNVQTIYGFKMKKGGVR